MGPQELHIGTINLDLTGLALLEVLVTAERGEAPVLGDNDLLTARESGYRLAAGIPEERSADILVLRPSQRLDGGRAVGITGPDGQDDLANIDTGDGAVGLSPGTTHTGLQPIRTGTGQHLVDADNVEWVSAAAKLATPLKLQP
jgi:hypothetical protein